MGLFDKILRKSQKSAQNPLISGKPVNDQKEAKAKEELSLAELKEKKVKLDASTGKTVAKVAHKEDTKNAYRVLLKPVVTEKGTYLGVQNKYIFEVAIRTNKIGIKKAIKALYGVSPKRVNIVTVSGKNVRYGRSKGRTKDKKKAIITLAKGQSLEIYEGV